MDNLEKQNVKEVCTLPELQMNDEEYAQYMKKQLKKSNEDFKNGRVVTLEEFEQEMEALYESYNV